MNKWLCRLLIPAAMMTACGPAAAPDTETTAEAMNACETGCINDYSSCEMQCVMDMVDEYGFELCMNDCDDDYNTCMYDDFRLRGPTFSICHLDVDVHWFDVDTEFYTVDAWMNVSCNPGPDRFRKRYLGKVTCSHWQLMEDFVNNGWDAQAIQNGECADRAAALMVQLSAQGYFPGTMNLDEDDCPHPRI